MKILFLFASIAVASGLLLTNIYTSIVDAKSWGADIPQSIDTARQYYKLANPGDFFRIFSPANQLLGVLALIVYWKSSPGTRLYLGIALVMYLLGEALTFMYFYPRNAILFKTASLTDVETLKRVWSEWNTMNWVRSLVILIGLVFSFMSLHKIYSLK
jgi:Domain of unknown function (DUF1772)